MKAAKGKPHKLLNYTTMVAADRTVTEIQDILRRHGATACLTEYDGSSHVVALSFKVKTASGELPFRLPCRADAVYKILRERPRRRYDAEAEMKDKAQAERVAWRIIKDWVEAQMALIESEMVLVEQVFLPYAVTPSGETVGQLFAKTQFKLLTEGKQ